MSRYPADTPTLWAPDPAGPTLPRTDAPAGVPLRRPATDSATAFADTIAVAPPAVELPLPPPELPALADLADLSARLEQAGWPRLDDTTRLPQAVPFYLGSQDEDGSNRISAWWHPADPAAAAADARLGVVLCSALGREELSSHATLRHLAERLAASGITALRFDYPCTGDSGGEDLDPQAPQRWLRSIEVAADALRRSAGVHRLILFGLRAGALMAAQVAAGRDDIAGMICWMPVLSGRQYLREARLLGGDAAAATPGGIFESGGFALSEHASRTLQGWDTRRIAPGCRNWLVVERDDLDDALLPGWATALRDGGAAVHHVRAPGYATLMLDAHHARVPQPWCDATLAWLGELARAPQPPATAPRMHRGAMPGLELRGSGVREQCVRIRADESLLYGVLTEPLRDPGRERRCVLLLNAGAVHRIGPGRMNVLLARRLARVGHTVLRLDLAGLGESAPLPGQSGGVVYPDAAVPQVLAAVRFLQQHLPGSTTEVIGLCAGAYHALQAARACARPSGHGHQRHAAGIGGVLAINPLTFMRPEVLEGPGALSAQKAAGEMARYRAGLWSAQRWQRLLRGEINLLNPLRVMRRQARSRLRSQWREALRTFGHPAPDDVGHMLARIARSGMRIGFVFSEGDPGARLLRLEAGSSLDGLRRAHRLHWFDVAGADHTFTQLSAREDLVQLVLRWCHERRS